MIETTTNFDTYNALKHKNPVWIVEFNGIATKFCSQTFVDIDSNYKKYLKDFFIEPIQIDLETLDHVFGGYNFRLIDKDSEITQIVIDNDIINKKIDIKYGFQELEIADFINLPSAYITNCQVSNDLISYEFNSRILSKELSCPAIVDTANATLAAGGCSSSTQTITAIGMSNYPDTNGCFQIEDEYIFYATKVSNAWDVFYSCQRGIAGTTQKAHDGYTPIYPLVHTADRGGSFIARLLTNTSAGTNGILDDGYYYFGSGIDESLIDINGILNDDWKHANAETDTLQNFDYYFSKDDENTDDIIKEILHAVPGILRFNNNKLKVQYLDYDIYDLYVDSVIDSDIKINSYKQGNIFNIIKNQVKKYNQGSFQVNEIIRLAESVTKYGKSRSILINSPQAWTQKVGTYHPILGSGYGTLAGDDLGQAIIMRFFMIFGQENFFLDFDTYFNKIIWEVGDVIRVTHLKLPDFENGGRGIENKNFMIYEKAVNSDGTLNFKLLGYREPLDKLNIATINRVEYANITHPGTGYMAYNSDHNEATYQADYDAKYDNDITQYNAHIVRFDFEIVVGAFGSIDEKNEYISIDIIGQDAPGFNSYNREVRCYFDNTREYTFYPSYYLYRYDSDGILNSTQFVRLRADYFGYTAYHDDITIRLFRLLFIKFNTTLEKSLL